MSGWKIDPAGVGKVVDRVQAQAEALDAGLRGGGLDHVLDGLGWGAGFIDCVPDAVSHAMESQATHIANVMIRIQAGLQGAVGATIAYVNADAKMAAAMQSHAAKAAADGDFSWLQRNRQW